MLVSRRRSDTSCNKEYFDKAVTAYNNELKINGFCENIEFTSTLPPSRNRNRKIIWFNPPYSVNLKSNINLFNRNNIKISYSCMPNMASDILNHNISLLKGPAPNDIKECSCCQKPQFPLEGNCVSGYLAYNASVDRQATKLNIIMKLARRALKSVIATTQHPLEIKVKKKAFTSMYVEVKSAIYA